ncbi:MAG: c-type cytochrome [Candidatus Marinimicrobia bacterium]|nr:c-type cytochrome [Candidatus Neomarinimicrobiota bacterium]
MAKQERYYNILKLNKLFAISSIVFLILLIWTFEEDYSRDWKEYQREFRLLEEELTSNLLEQEKSRITGLSDYKVAQQEMAAAEKSLDNKRADLQILQKQLKSLNNEHYKVEQQLAFDKAQYDAAKYEYEEAVGKKHGDVKSTKKRFDHLDIEVKQLTLKLEDVVRRLNQQKKTIQDFLQEVNDAEKSIGEFTRKIDLYSKKLTKIDPGSMTVGNRMADFIRDLPVLDFLNPYYKIDQIVIKDITEDLIFTKVPKVDRCTTCHLGIAKPEYEDASQPFRTHPNPDLYITNKSYHPMESFGCTSCHGGRGRGTGFITSAHTPKSEEQELEWVEKYQWHEMHHWETPMFPKQYLESGCFKCHSEEIFLSHAEKLNLGTNLIEKAGCFGCHTIERYKDKRLVGPDLNKIPSKISRDWTYLWIRDPKSFRHNTWMPKFFGLENNSDPESQARTEQEIHAIIHYLYKNGKDFPLYPIPRLGNPERGEELINSLGCLGCHRIEPEPFEETTSLQTLRRDHGPNLIGLASKTTSQWIYNWLKQPERYFPRTKMPNLRLTDEEAADITSYLMTMSNGEFLEHKIPPLDEGVIDNIVKNFLLKMFSDFDSREKLKSMTLENKLDYAGEKLIRLYGCFGCHNIPGFENEKPIGTELTEEGSKPVEKLDFGLLDIKHSREVWFTQKLKHPRSFDRDKVKGDYEKLRMPDFEFSDVEVEAIVTALQGFVKTSYGIKPVKSQNPDVHMGQWLVREYNCQGCHIIENDGGAIRPTIQDWLIDQYAFTESDAEGMIIPFSPPDLNTQGDRTQPNWLFDFLKNPTSIRPNLRVRMPTFNFTDSDWSYIIKYFLFLDGEVATYESKHSVDMKSFQYLAGKELSELGACDNCHFYGTTFPKQTPDTWAPNLAMTKVRLKPEWVIQWLKNPQDIMNGTKMPAPYIPTKEDLAVPEIRESFGRGILNLDGDQDAMLRGITDFMYTIPGKTDISKEIKDYFDKNGYDFLQQEEDEWGEWE